MITVVGNTRPGDIHVLIRRRAKILKVHGRHCNGYDMKFLKARSSGPVTKLVIKYYQIDRRDFHQSSFVGVITKARKKQ